MDGDMDMRHGHVAWTWTYSMDMDIYNQRGLAVWAWTWTFSMVMDMQHWPGHTAWKWKIRSEIDWKIGNEMKRKIRGEIRKSAKMSNNFCLFLLRSRNGKFEAKRSEKVSEKIGPFILLKKWNGSAKRIPFCFASKWQKFEAKRTHLSPYVTTSLWLANNKAVQRSRILTRVFPYTVRRANDRARNYSLCSQRLQ